MNNTMMALPMEKPGSDSACDGTCVDRRLKWLVAVHLVVCMSSVVGMPDVNSVWLRLACWVMNEIPVGTLMLLAFWAGLGTNSRMTRLAGAVLGSAYLAFGPNLTHIVAGGREPLSSWFAKYLPLCIFFSFTVFLGAAICLPIRRWIAELRRIPCPDDCRLSARPQCSILRLLVMTAAVAIMLGLTTYARLLESSDEEILVTYLAHLVCGYMRILCLAVAGAWAALGLGRLRWRLPLVVLLTFVLAISLQLTSNANVWINRIAIGEKLATSVLFEFTPMAVFVGSLLVVRSCGYRLVPKSSGAGTASRM